MIAKDILKNHAIYWPCMLKAAKIPMFQRLLVHGFWVIGGSKMSKSLGNVVDPLEMRDRVGVDSLRYFLARDMSFGEDSNFTEEVLLARYNADLANNIGNLINRSISMSRSNFNDCVPPKGNNEELEIELIESFNQGIETVKTNFYKFQLHRALEQIASMSSQVNKYLDTTAPWKLAKQESDRARLGTVLYTALDTVRVIIQLLSPVMPEKMKLILNEATSTLDTHSERLIQQAIEATAKQTTVIVIAHRLSTIVNADYVYVLNKGRVVEEGTYSELVGMNNSQLKRMAQLQVLKAAT